MAGRWKTDTQARCAAGGKLGKRTHVAEAQHRSRQSLRFGLTQHIDRDAMGFVGRGDPAIHGDQKEDVLDLLGAAAVGECAFDMDAQLVAAPGAAMASDLVASGSAGRPHTSP